MVEIVDPIPRIDNTEGHESDKDGHKKMNNEGQCLLVRRNGKYPEHGIVSFNVMWEMCSLHDLRDFHFARLRSVSRFLQKRSEKSRLKEVRRYPEYRAGTR